MAIKAECTSCFKALAVPSRMKMFAYLEGKGEASVTELVSVAGLKQPTVSYHLKEMEHSGLLSSQKKGKTVTYKITHVCPYDHERCVLG